MRKWRLKKVETLALDCSATEWQSEYSNSGLADARDWRTKALAMPSSSDRQPGDLRCPNSAMHRPALRFDPGINL